MSTIFPKSEPLSSAPVPGEVLNIDTTDNTATVSIGGQVVDNVTWFGSPPPIGDTVYMTDTGSRLIIISPGAPPTDDSAIHAEILAKAVQAGNGLTGGGALSGNPTLHVGAGSHIQVDADSIRLAPHCVSINDWNEAVYDGFYMAPPGAANPPGTSLGAAWSYGIVVSHNPAWVFQRAWMFASSYPSGLEFQRWCWNGSWSAWRRTNNYVESYASLDGLVYNEHSGVRRFAAGLKSDVDEWRVQCYDGSGNYTKSGIRVLQDGRVIMRDTMQSGADSITPVANQNTTKRINFDQAFSTTPQVQVTIISGVVGSTVQGWAATGVDTGGFSMNILRTNNTSTSFMWTATAD